MERKPNQQPQQTKGSEQKVAIVSLSNSSRPSEFQAQNLQEKLALEGGRGGLGETTDSLYQ